MPNPQTLRDLLTHAAPVSAPGCFDALSALLIERAGFTCAYVSGANIAYTKLGRPDLGLVSMTEVAETISAISDRVSLPLVVDADTGFGNALNVQRTVRLFERAGANAIQIEDQVTPKKCGHLKGKALIGEAEMIGKVKAAVDARQTQQTLIVARTDAIAVEGISCALDRAAAYAQAGADLLFVEAPQNLGQMQQITSRFGASVPLMANMVEGGSTPLKSAAELGEMGFSLVIFPGTLMRAYAFMAGELLAYLKDQGSTADWAARMVDFTGLNNIIGLPDMMEAEARYSARGPDDPHSN